MQTLLLVDDEPNIVEGLVFCLQKLGGSLRGGSALP